MEFVRSNEDMSLYKYNDGGKNRFLVYKGNDMYLELLDGNKKEFEKFFNVQL